jgi:N4-gp56 family major capsid protein
MAETTVLSGLDLTKWRKQFIREYIRDSGFEPYMGDAPTDIIHVVNDLKSDGYTIRVPLVARLQGNGVSGNSRLSGAEERMDQYYQDISWEFYRNAIEISKKEREKSAVDLLEARRPLLREWASELVKYQLIESFHTMSSGTTYANADSTARNAFLANNSDRVLFGKLKSNYSSGVMATALGTLDTTDDILSPAIGSLAKRMARTANPHIRPFKTGTQGREYYVMFCHPLAFKTLKSNATIIANNQYARAREGSAMDSNPLFQDGDLIDDGIIYREIPEFWQARQGNTSSTNVNPNTHLLGAGASSADVGVNFLCGAQAVAMVNKQAATPITKKEDDYGFFDGVGIELAQGFSKLRWNNGSGTNRDLGMVTVYTAIVADA